MDVDQDNQRQERHPNGTASANSSSHGACITEEAQRVRRNSIRDILADDTLSESEKRKSIQSLMDGRRRSSNGSSASLNEMARTATDAADYYNSDIEGDAPNGTRSAATTTTVSSDGSISNHSLRQQYLQDWNGNHTASPSQHNSSSHHRRLAALQYSYDTDMADTSDGHPRTDNNSNNGDTDTGASTDSQSHQLRRQRSSSLPLWSDNNIQAVAPLAAASSNIWDDPINVNRRMEKSRPQCNHYERNCTIISPCCGLAFGCRFCHDECPVLPLPFSKRRNTQQQHTQVAWTENSSTNGSKRRQEKRPSLPLGFDEEETHHEIDRFAIREVICRMCYVRQTSKSNFCNTCQVQFGEYHCSICNLWMSAEEDPYHCSECGFCRVGGRNNFRHCSDCGMCIDTQLFDDHNCKAGKYMSNCPVCQEDLFSSRDASHEMPCGHAIHWHCFRELTSYDTRCPVCKKTAETPEHMAPTWQAMAMGIALQPVPPELARAVTIMCNDCEQRDEDRRWHFLGVRCTNCMSFNTTVEKTTMAGREAAAYLDELDRARGDGDEGGESSDEGNTAAVVAGDDGDTTMDAEMS